VNYKAAVPAAISRAIQAFGIGREMVVRILAAIHEKVPRDYPQCRQFRIGKDERYYRYRIVLKDDQVSHLFRMAVDDTTAEGHLIVVDIRHKTRPCPPKS
jgi:hypothetical protein